MFKRLREEWLYWRYRNITRRWLLLKPKLRLRRHSPVSSAAFRARGSAMYMPRGRSGNRGLLFVAVVAAVLAIVNTAQMTAFHRSPSLLIDLILLAVMTYAYLQYGGV